MKYFIRIWFTFELSMNIPTQRRTVLWSGIGVGLLSIGVMGIDLLPDQSQAERDLMEERAAIRAFEIYEEELHELDEEDVPEASIESIETIEPNDHTLITGDVHNEQDDGDRVAVAARIEFNDEPRYGWTELSIDPSEIEVYEIEIETPDTFVDDAVDVVAVDWHI